MLRSYFKTAIRFLLKNKTFSFINIIGLAAGTLCCLYILLYVQDQYSYDKHQKNGENIYRITTTLALTGDKHTNSTCSPPIAPTSARVATVAEALPSYTLLFAVKLPVMWSVVMSAVVVATESST